MNKLKTYIQAGYACLQCTTYEEDRVAAEIVEACKDINGHKYMAWQWDIVNGLVNQDGKSPQAATKDPGAALALFLKHDMKDVPDSDPAIREPYGTEIENRSVVILRDFHLILKSGSPMLIRMMKECIRIGRATYRHLIIIGCQLHLPPELEKEITVIDYGLPTKDELLIQAKALAENNGKKLNGNTDDILSAGSGLTTTEFCDAVAKAIVETGEVDPAVISEIKADTIKKGGILEIIKPGVTFDDLGGLGELKRWVMKRRRAFSKQAVDYGLPMPKGVCIYGVQGAGKSLATRAIASELSCPLIRLDAGRLFGGIVGQSEANVRSVISQVEAFGTCVLQIEEIDKGFAGMVGGHDGDSGTTRRVIGTFLTWMQEKTSPVFVVATANDLTRLPPELLRKGRWDELFFIDLPTREERVEIWRVQIARHGRVPDHFGLDNLAGATDKWTGAEIEALFNEGLYSAFDDGCEPTTDLLLSISKDTKPLSATMAEQIESLRKWSIGRSRNASLTETSKAMVPLLRKIA